MVIRIDKIKPEGIDIIEAVLEEYIESIRNQMFTMDMIINQNNVIEETGLSDSISETVNNETALINSYIDNVLLSFNDSLEEFKRMKEKR